MKTKYFEKISRFVIAKKQIGPPCQSKHKKAKAKNISSTKSLSYCSLYCTFAKNNIITDPS